MQFSADFPNILYILPLTGLSFNCTSPIANLNDLFVMSCNSTLYSRYNLEIGILGKFLFPSHYLVLLIFISPF